jgi:hypothetical protein
MPKYTIIDEGYDVTICKSIKEVFSWVKGLCEEGSEDKQITLSGLRKSLANDFASVRFYDKHGIYTAEDSDWYFKVQKHK